MISGNVEFSSLKCANDRKAPMLWHREIHFTMHINTFPVVCFHMLHYGFSVRFFGRHLNICELSCMAFSMRIIYILAWWWILPHQRMPYMKQIYLSLGIYIPSDSCNAPFLLTFFVMTILECCFSNSSRNSIRRNLNILCERNQWDGFSVGVSTINASAIFHDCIFGNIIVILGCRINCHIMAWNKFVRFATAKGSGKEREKTRKFISGHVSEIGH